MIFVFKPSLIFWLQNPRWLRNTAGTSSQHQWCHLLSTLEALLQEWIESSVLLFITLWLIVVKWKKACVVPLSSGSRTGSSQSFFNLSNGKISTRRCGKATKMQPMAGDNKPRTWARCRRRSSEQCCLPEPSVDGIPWRQLFCFFSHLNKIGGFNS